MEYLLEKVVIASRQPKCKKAHEVHECLREPGIMSGYRHENCSVPQVLVSLFKTNNETLNFWTHFVPSIYFIHFYIGFYLTLPLLTEPYYYPFVCFMVTSCMYPFISCLAHAFSCLSIPATHICFFIDYAGLAIYSWGSAMLYFYYCFPPSINGTWFSEIFLHVAFFNVCLSTVMACSSRFITNHLLAKALRLGAFIIPYLWDSLPLLWRLCTCDHEDCGDSFVYHVRQFIAVFAACFFYATHLPERLAPGRFDFIGHSHNFLHLFGVIGTNEQIHGAFTDMINRKRLFDAKPQSEWYAWWSVVASPMTLVLSSLIIIVFSFSIAKKCSKSTKRQ